MIKNASQPSQVYYGLHMEPGVAEYRESGKEPYRILIKEDTIKNMDPTFQAKPVYVMHKDEVNLEELQNEADGYVSESFYNKLDGKHWCKFIAVSDKAHEAIRKGWRLSNCYKITNHVGGGQWHGVDYVREVKNGTYDHLAIVPNPRYEGSVIMTPEQFKEYNSKREIELKKLSNSKGEKKVGLLNIFKKEKVENAADLESMSVILANSKTEVTIAEAVAIADSWMGKKANMQGYANGDHMVKVGEEEMSVNDMAKYADKMKKKEAEEAEVENAKKKKNEADAAAAAAGEPAKPVEPPKEGEPAAPPADPAAAVAAAEAVKNAIDKEGDENFKKLKNAREESLKNAPKVELGQDQVARGKDRYGSGR